MSKVDPAVALKFLVEDFNSFISAYGSPEQKGTVDRAYPHWIAVELGRKPGQINVTELEITAEYIKSRFTTEGKYSHLLPKVMMFNGTLCLVVDADIVSKFIIRRTLENDLVTLVRG